MDPCFRRDPSLEATLCVFRRIPPWVGRSGSHGWRDRHRWKELCSSQLATLSLLFLRFVENLLWLLVPGLGLWRHLFGMQKCTSPLENSAVAEGACLILINTIAVKEGGFELLLCAGNHLNPGLLCPGSVTLWPVLGARGPEKDGGTTCGCRAAWYLG